MATVRQILADLTGGKTSLEETADLFRQRRWETPRPPTDGQRWGVIDDDAPGDDEWGTVDANSSLTSAQYEVLAQAYRDALKKQGAARSGA